MRSARQLNHCFLIIFALCWMLCSIRASAAVLENELWRIEIEPSTLAIRATPTDHSAVQASAGVDARQVTDLQTSPAHARWQWDDGQWQIDARLQSTSLLLTIVARDPGTLEFLRQPGASMGQGLIWPSAEGRYIPRGDELRQNVMLEQGRFNTTQDLSLPLWGVDFGGFTLSWILTNPYNNQLMLTADSQGLAISARHDFTPLDPAAALTFRLHLGRDGLLAGARHYRQWLIDTGQHESLVDKLEETSEAAGLIGAPHLYLWGSDLLGQKDVRNWPALLERLRSNDPLATRLRRRLDPESASLISRVGGPLDRYQKSSVLRGLNDALNSVARESWQGMAIPDMEKLAAAYGALRSTVADVFADALTTDAAEWGDTLSIVTINKLEAAGLKRLWLGVADGWEGGLWHPEAVRAAVRAGYLIAPYDSYETALPATENFDWATAHLGSDAVRDCPIVLKDGTLKKGFQQSGHYVDPRCVRPLLEGRIKAIQAQAGFNSWFLDAYAAGMLFDSYKPGATLTQQQKAAAHIDAARWITQVQGLPVGSEDGNAVTAQGIVFAHGMQTPYFGWGDTDLETDQQSPFYLGAWHPRRQPELFFKPTPVKEPYLSMHFDPATRLPLYQAVFHGSLITSHHWLFDSLKLSNVRAWNELVQLLYNVPPLYNLSTDTLKERLPAIQRQDKFFRPLHQRLAARSMTDFRWLTEDRQVQQTTFADGSRLIANFALNEREVAGQTYAAQSIKAFLASGETTEYRVVSPSAPKP
ncbi:MAG TPA: glycoside hydrolase [Pseudomonas sp.]|jgi:hypothetical protein